MSTKIQKYKPQALATLTQRLLESAGIINQKFPVIEENTTYFERMVDYLIKHEQTGNILSVESKGKLKHDIIWAFKGHPVAKMDAYTFFEQVISDAVLTGKLADKWVSNSDAWHKRTFPTDVTNQLLVDAVYEVWHNAMDQAALG